jgi:hypothetical protein
MPDVERRVVRDQHRVARELEEAPQRLRQARRVATISS